MIINTLNQNKIKILADIVDLKKAGILPDKLISNSNQTLSCIKELLKSTTNFSRRISLKRLFYLYI